MESEVSALMSAADEEHWERSRFFFSVDAISGIKDTYRHSGERG
jgi:hypothetical protein